MFFLKSNKLLAMKTYTANTHGVDLIINPYGVLQILSPAGHVISSRKIQVGRGRVKLERILVRVVSGLTLQIAKDRHLLGALTATAVLEDKLVARQQVMKCCGLS